MKKVLTKNIKISFIFFNLQPTWKINIDIQKKIFQKNSKNFFKDFKKNFIVQYTKNLQKKIFKITKQNVNIKKKQKIFALKITPKKGKKYGKYKKLN